MSGVYRLITGSYDGALKLWSQEGRCLEQLDDLCDTITGVCYVPSTKNYWVAGETHPIGILADDVKDVCIKRACLTLM